MSSAPPSFANNTTPHPSISPIVDAEYRIYPADLQGTTRRVEVANVTFQGVEAMTPVLHFIGQSKRLVLTAEQVAQMVEITGTVLMARWIGTVVLLSPSKHKESPTIMIKPLTRRQRGQPMPMAQTDDQRGWILALSIVGLIFSASIIVVLFNYASLVTTLQQLQEYWPLR